MVSMLSMKRSKVQTAPSSYDTLRERKKIIYKENGNREFVHDGYEDVYEKIQSFKDACSIENIIKRCTNDPSVLHRRDGVFADITKIPNNMADAMAVINDAKSIFEKQKAEGKTNAPDFDHFLKGFGTATGLAHFVAQNSPKPVDKPAPAAAPAAAPAPTSTTGGNV